MLSLPNKPVRVGLVGFIASIAMVLGIPTASLSANTEEIESTPDVTVAEDSTLEVGELKVEEGAAATSSTEKETEEQTEGTKPSQATSEPVKTTQKSQPVKSQSREANANVVTTEQELRDAVKEIGSGEGEIVISGTIDLSERLAFTTAGADITIRGSENGATVTRKGISSGTSPIYVSAGTVTFGSDSNDFPLTFDGKGAAESTADGLWLEVEGNAKVVLNSANFINANGAGAENTSTVMLDGRNATITMNGGSISHNRNDGSKNSSGAAHTAGGVQVFKGTFTMNDGSISDNVAHRTGGVSIGSFYGDLSSNPDPAKFIMNGGEIARNQGRFLGGGVYIIITGDMEMNGGTIADNVVTGGQGGGVLVQDGYASVNPANPFYSVKTKNTTAEEHSKKYPGRFTMNGGTISGNQSKLGSRLGGTGGGIFIASNEVHLNGGKILNNHADSYGGGIGLSMLPYHLYAGNLVITGNEAQNSGYYLSHVDMHPGSGGGIWLCPESSARLYNDGTMAIFDNNAGYRGNDVSFSKSLKAVGRDFFVNGKTYTTDLYKDLYTDHPKMCGPDWQGAKWYEDRSGHRYDPQKPQLLESAALTNSTNSLNVDAGDTFNQQQKASLISGAKVLVKGNSASMGGGIGGNFEISDGTPPTRSLPVRKTWEGPVPKDIEQVTAQLYLDGMLFQEVQLKKDTGWSGEFTKIPMNTSCHEYKLEVREVPVDGYSPVISGETDDSVANVTLKRTFSDATYGSGDWEYDNPDYFNDVVNWYADEWPYKSDHLIIDLTMNGKKWDEKPFIFVSQQSIFPDEWEGYFSLPIKKDAKVNFTLKDQGRNEETGAPAYALHRYQVDITGSPEKGYTVALPDLAPYITAKGKYESNTDATNNPGFSGESRTSSFAGINIHNQLTRKITVQKKWDKDVTDAQKKPITVGVYRPGEEEPIASGVLNQENNWKMTFTNLPSYKSDPVDYEVREVVPEGFKVIYSDRAQNYRLLLRIDNPSFHGFDEYTFRVHVPKYELNGQRAVDGKGKPQFQAMEKELLLKNMPTSEEIGRSWSDITDPLDLPVKQAPFKVQVDQSHMDDPYYNPKYPQDIYVDGSTQKGWTITLPYNPKFPLGVSMVPGADTPEYTVIVENKLREKTDIEVQKQWVDGESVRPDEVGVQLLRDGEPYGDPVKLDADNGWKYTWKDLYAEDQSGKKYQYFVEELNVKGFISTVETNDSKSFLLKNKYEVPRTSVEANKVWNTDDEEPPAINLQLIRKVGDGKFENVGDPVTLDGVVDEGVAGADDPQKAEGEYEAWKYRWVDLPVTTKAGEKYSYAIREVTKLDGYTSKIDGMTVINDQIPSEPTTGPSEPSEPTEPTTGPTEPSEPTEPTTAPSKPTEPTTGPTEPTTAPSEPTEPMTGPSESTTVPSEPTEPTSQTSEPTTEPTVPVTPPNTPPNVPPTPSNPGLPKTGVAVVSIAAVALALGAGGALLVRRRRLED